MIPDLASYDVIVLNSSAGKDSQAMTDYVCGLAQKLGILSRVVMVHCDLGPRVEWPGTRELAEEHAKVYGVPLKVVSRPQGDLLAQVQARGMWPSSTNRYCTSDQKRDQVAKCFTEFVRSLDCGRPVRILNCQGIRAQESAARAKKQPFQRDTRNSNGKRTVDLWYPIFEWTTSRVWSEIKRSGVRHHPAYDLGMPRLSCMFCIFAGEDALLLAGHHNRPALDEYVRVETKIGHTFRDGFTLGSIAQRLDAGELPGQVADFKM